MLHGKKKIKSSFHDLYDSYGMQLNHLKLFQESIWIIQSIQWKTISIYFKNSYLFLGLWIFLVYAKDVVYDLKVWCFILYNVVNNNKLWMNFLKSWLFGGLFQTLELFKNSRENTFLTEIEDEDFT